MSDDETSSFSATLDEVGRSFEFAGERTSLLGFSSASASSGRTFYINTLQNTYRYESVPLSVTDSASILASCP